MAAVSALPNGRGLRTGGGVAQDPDSWDYGRSSGQEVSFSASCAAILALSVLCEWSTTPGLLLFEKSKQYHLLIYRTQTPDEVWLRADILNP